MTRRIVLFLITAAYAYGGTEFLLGTGEQAVANQWLVRLKPGAATSVISSLWSGAQITALRLPNHFIVRVPDGRRAANLASNPLVDVIEPDRIRKTTLSAPNDPFYSQTGQWGLSTVQALQAWNLVRANYLTAATAGSGRIKVAVLDTGADCGHPDFINAGGSSTDSAQGGQISWSGSRAYYTTTVASPACAWQDDHGHGTHVAGILAAATSNGVGVSSLGYSLEVLSYKVLDSTGSGSDSVIASAIVAAADAGAKVISMSLGGAGYSSALQAAIDYAWQKNVVVVAAAGNAASSALNFPGGANHAVGVSASDTNNALASFSNTGDQVAVAAPGVGILSTFPRYSVTLGCCNYASLSGTSMSTPFVSALAGLLAATTPNATAASIVQRIQQSAMSSAADGGWSTSLGYGIINAYNAVGAVARSTSTGGVVGQIVDASGTAVSGARITVAGKTFTTDSSGLYWLRQIAAGAYPVTITAPGFASQSMTVTVAAGADTPFTVAMGVSYGRITGNVADAGLGVSGVVVEALSGGSVAGIAVTDTTGAYTLWLKPGTGYTVQASQIGSSTASVGGLSVTAGTATPANLTMASLQGAITGVVRDATGSPAVGATVTVTSSVLTRTAVTDAAGAYLIRNLPTADVYSVTATSTGGGPASQGGVSVSVDGVTTVNLQLTALPAAAPVFTPPTGTYLNAQSVTITTTTLGASIRYTTDGSTPSETVGTLYTGPVAVTGAVTLKAMAYTGLAPSSAVASATYAIKPNGWYATGGNWTYRKALTIDHTKISGSASLSNFPVLVSLTDANLASAAKSNAGDLVFTAADGVTRLDHEIEQYNSATGSLQAWVRIPSLSPSADTKLFVYYGNAAAGSPQSGAAVWDSNYAGVWHLGDGVTLSTADSTANANHGVNSGATASAGNVGGAGSFNGNGAYIGVDSSNSLNFTGDGSWSAWVKLSDTTSTHDIFNKDNSNQWAVGVAAGGKIFVWLTPYVYQSARALPVSSWQHVAVTKVGNILRFYVNGTLDSSGTIWSGSTVPTGPTRLGIGAKLANSSEYMKGLIDEGRISSSARSADWIATEYNNQSAPGTFVAAGSQEAESNPPGQTAVIVTSSPAGLTLTVDGTSCTAPCSAQWTPGSTHTIAAATQAGATGTQYVFASWSDSGAGSHTVTAPSSAMTYTATFTTQYYLTTAASPSAGGSIAPASGWRDAGAVVPVSATANGGYQFSGFSGGLTGTTTPQNVTMNAPVTVTASFALSAVAVTLTSAPAGRTLTVDGADCTAPCSAQWIPGSSHTIAAATQAGSTGTQYVFVSWSDAGAASHGVTAPSSPATYTATFQTQYYLTTTASPSSGGAISPASGWFDAGAPVAVRATANGGYQFSGFNGALAGSANPQNLSMNAPSIRQVGPGKTYSKPCAAIAAASDGDTILIDASGNYDGDVCGWSTNGLTIRGVNGRPHIDAAGANAAGKGIWVIAGNDNVVENIEFSGAAVPDGNGAGIRFEGINLTIRNSYFHHNQNGILTSSPLAGEVRIEYSEFAFNGVGDGQTHNVYVNQVARLTFRFNYSHDVVAGHLLKTRAAENYVLYNRLTTEDGDTSYELDIPYGGLSYVIGNVFHQGPNSQNNVFLSYQGEGATSFNASSALYVVNNTFVNDKSSGVAVRDYSSTPAVIRNNILAGAGTITDQGSAMLANNLSGVDPRFVNASGYDFRLQSGSPAIDAGVDPGSGGGQALSPAYSYTHPECGESRAAVGAIDIGAFEFGNSGVAVACGAPVTVSGPATVTATFTTTPPVAVTVTSAPAGRMLTVDGTSCTAPCSAQWTPGSTHTIAAATEAGATGTQYVFASWSDSGAASHTVTAPSSATTYTATFTTQYYLTTSASPSAGGSIAPASGWRDAGSVVSVSATANGGYQFSGFSGGLTGTATPQNVTMSGPVAVTATFTATPVSVTVTSAPAGRTLTVDGTSCTAPCSAQWTPGSTHTIAAATQAGATGTQYVFTSWSDNGAASHTVTAPSSATTYTATFTTQYYVTTSASPSAGGSIAPASGWRDAGSVVAVSATANGGYQFSGFSGGLTGTATPQNVTMSGPVTVTATFMAQQSGGSSWYSTGGVWANRKAITINRQQVAGALTNFPVLVKITDANLQAGAKADGSDLVFTASDGVTKLSHEIEQYNAATGDLVAWVNVPSLSGSADTTLYLYYGNAAASGQQNAAGVWDANYVGVWHLGNSVGLTTADSTANGNHGVNNGATSGAGAIGRAAVFGGTNSIRVANSASLNFTGDGTWSAWINLTGVSGTHSILHKDDSNQWALGVATGGKVFLWVTPAVYQRVGSLTVGVWNHVEVTKTGTTAVFYINGVASGTVTLRSATLPVGPTDLGIGAKLANASEYMKGSIDEARISKSGRTSSWVATEYNNQSSPATFLSVGAQETYGVPPVTVTVASAPAGRTLTVDGTSCTAPCTAQWIPGSSHTIAAATEAGPAGTQYVFASWSDSGAASHTVTAPSTTTTYTATFTTQYYLTTAASPSAGGSIAPASGWRDAGSVVAVSATANGGYQFSGFSGGLSGTTTPQNVTMSGPVSVTASFTSAAVTITVTSAPAGRTLTVDGTSCTAPCTAQWIPGSTHTIAAATEAGATGTQYVFASWSDSGAASHTVTAPSTTTTYTATFTTQYYLTTSASPSAGGSIAPASGWRDAGSVLSVSATANGGYQFSGFSGGLTGTTTPQNVTMSGPVSVTASFTSAAVTITVTSAPAGRTLTVDGTSCTAPCTAQWLPGSTHTIAAATEAGPAGTQYVFASWSDSGAASHTVTAPSSSTTYTATFTTQYYLTTAASPSAGGSIAPASGWRDAGSVVSVSATANGGYQFSGFSGGLTGTATPQNVTMSGPVTVTASFTSAAVTVTVTSAPAGRTLTVDGTSCTAPCSAQWTPGSNHTIAAATQAGATGTQYVFTSWSDNGAASHTVTAPSSATTYTATFTTQYYLTTAASPSAGGSIAPASGWRDAGSVVAVSATANGGYQFSGFSGGLTGTATPQNVTMSGPVTVTATFMAQQSGGSSWYSTGGVWANRKAITINRQQVAGALTNFPVLVKITDANLQAMAKADGSDLVFTASDGVTKLSHEIEQYNAATGDLVAWVNVPSLSGSADTTLYLYYGNAAASGQQNAAGVWDGNYVGVWHLGNSAGLTTADSTANGNHGVNNGATSGAGAIGRAAVFGGTNSIRVGNSGSLNFTGDGTWSAWVNLTDVAGTHSILHKDDSNQWALGVATGGKVFLWVTPAVYQSVGSLTVGVWNHVEVTKTGATAVFYINGVASGTVTLRSATLPVGSTDFGIGAKLANASEYMKGSIDEARISKSGRTSSWVATEYNNQRSPATFLTVGAQETLAAGATRLP